MRHRLRIDSFKSDSALQGILQSKKLVSGDRTWNRCVNVPLNFGQVGRWVALRRVEEKLHGRQDLGVMAQAGSRWANVASNRRGIDDLGRRVVGEDACLNKLLQAEP